KQRRDEPATAVLPAVHTDVVRNSRQLTLHGVVASADIELILREAIEPFADILPDGAVGELRRALPRRRLDVAEELQPTDLDERVHDEGVDVVAEAGPDRAGPRIGGLGRCGI